MWDYIPKNEALMMSEVFAMEETRKERKERSLEEPTASPSTPQPPPVAGARLEAYLHKSSGEPFVWDSKTEQWVMANAPGNTLGNTLRVLDPSSFVRVSTWEERHWAPLPKYVIAHAEMSKGVYMEQGMFCVNADISWTFTLKTSQLPKRVVAVYKRHRKFSELLFLHWAKA